MNRFCMRKKILFITNTLCQGGAEHSLITTLNHVDKSKYDITLFIVKPVIDLYEKVPQGVRVIIGKELRHNYGVWSIGTYILEKIFMFIGNKKIANKLKNANSKKIYKRKRENIVSKFIKKEQFDMIVCNTLSNWSTEIACQISAKKRYLVYHGSTDTHHDMLDELLNNYYGVIAVSPGVKESFMRWYTISENRVIVIENLLEADIVKNAANEQMSVIEENDEIVICSCGRLTSEKGFDLAVTAASILKRKGYNFIWYFVGDGEERSFLEKKIKEFNLDNNICITGMMSNPFPIMSKCDIYVQPSYEESYGRTIKEAIILGKPVVSTDTVGGRYLLKHGKIGVLTSIDAEGIASGIEIYLQDHDKMRKCSNLYSDDDYRYECELYEKLWDQVLDS